MVLSTLRRTVSLACAMALAFGAVFTSAAGGVSSGLPNPSRALLGSGDYVEHLMSGGLHRLFVLHVPPGRPAVGRPLILVFPGAAATALYTISITNFEQMADRKGDLVAFMQGYGDIFNEGTGSNPSEMAHINDVAYTSAVLARLNVLTAYNIKRVAAAGFSNGAMMVELLGCRLARQLHVIVPVEGELPVPVSRRCVPSAPVSVFEIHGTADTGIPYAGGTFAGTGGPVTVLSALQSARRWAYLDGCRRQQIGVSGSAVSTIRYSKCRSGATVTLRTLIGGVHVWAPDIGQIVTTALGS